MKSWLSVAPFAPLLVALLAGAAPHAAASPLTYDFSVAVDGGPAAPQTVSGWFSFDDALVQPGQVVDAAANLLSSFAMDFMGTHYDAGNAWLQALSFDAGGALSGFLIGNDCPAGETFCRLDTTKSTWTLSALAFNYTSTSPPKVWLGTEAPVVASRTVPERSSWALALGGLVAGLALRRSVGRSRSVVERQGHALRSIARRRSQRPRGLVRLRQRAGGIAPRRPAGLAAPDGRASALCRRR